MFNRMLKQVALSHDRHAPIYMYGVLVPRGTKQALAFDIKNNNNYWQTGMNEEILQLEDYETFKDMGSGEITLPPEYQRDIGNAYLEAYTREKVYFIAGSEFGQLEGHTLVISKALYGLRTSGAHFHDRFADTLRAMNFGPCKADQDVRMRDRGSYYEYVCDYIDDIAVMMKTPQSFFDKLQGPSWNYKLKG